MNGFLKRTHPSHTFVLCTIHDFCMLDGSAKPVRRPKESKTVIYRHSGVFAKVRVRQADAHAYLLRSIKSFRHISKRSCHVRSCGSRGSAFEFFLLKIMTNNI
jgi:hypothetical protein